MTAWLDYIIASDDPADLALIEEHKKLSWSHGQIMQFITKDPANITEESYAQMAESTEAHRELDQRIYARGMELQAAGAQPATGERLAAWMAEWKVLAQNIYTGDTPVHEA